MAEAAFSKINLFGQCSDFCGALIQQIQQVTAYDSEDLNFNQRGSALCLYSESDQAVICSKLRSDDVPPVGIYKWSEEKNAVGVLNLLLHDKVSFKDAIEWFAPLIVVAAQLYNTPCILALKDEKFEASTPQGQGNECFICADKLEEDNIISRLPCQHYFHRQCVVSWLCYKETCPMCRHHI